MNLSYVSQLLCQMPLFMPGLQPLYLVLPKLHRPKHIADLIDLAYHLEYRRELLTSIKMALTGGAPPRGSAAAAAGMRMRRTTSEGATSGNASGTMLQFYTDEAPRLKISPNVVLIMSIGFIAFVAILHVMGKLYFVRKEA
ncbi:unnamed protein product [Rhodiola kirilowii]